ncbi:hypothetical protein DAI22_06g286666 [Oryza sativa Japonica Group]|nr:hypothetical protein DAI22_06g286666 [Oryza sativa Japonica Group]
MTSSGSGSTVLSQPFAARPVASVQDPLGATAWGERRLANQKAGKDGRSDARDFILPIPKHGNRISSPHPATR